MKNPKKGKTAPKIFKMTFLRKSSGYFHAAKNNLGISGYVETKIGLFVFTFVED